MGTNITGIGNTNAIGFKSRVTGGIYFPPELKDALVGVWSAYGKSNDSTDRNIIKNKIKDRGGDFVISNAAYKLNSGFGKYEITFQYFPYIENVTNVSDSKVVFGIGGQLLIPYSAITENIPSFKIKVSGLSGTYHFRYYYRSSDGVQHSIDMAQDGYYELPICYNVQSSSDGTHCGFANNGNDVVTITQIPSFEGAFVTDGIDDLITSTKTVQEMLGGSNEITVVSMIHQIDGNVNYTNGYTNYIRHGGGFIRNCVAGINGKGFNKTGIYGYTSTQLDSSNMGLGNVINNILGDKDDYSFERSSTYTLDDAKYSVQSFVNANNQPSNEGSSVAWYWTIIANKVLTTDQINQVIAYYNLDKYVKPDIYYDVKKQGLSNNTPDSDWYLKDFSGNGRDMQLYNFAKKLGSGIGKYEEDFTTWNKFSNVIATDNKLSTNKDFNSTWIVYKRANLSEISQMTIKVIGLPVGGILRYLYIKEGEIKQTSFDITKDGIYELPASYINEDISHSVGFHIPYINYDWSKLVIEQIPDYEGALVFDAVEDYGQFVGDLGLKDYTVAVDRAYAKLNDSQIPITSQVNKNELNTPFTFEALFNVSYTSTVAYSFGNKNEIQLPYNADRKISYQSKYVYDSKAITSGNGDSTGNGLTFGCNGTKTQHSALRLWSFMLFSYSLSEFLLERQLKRYKLGTLYPDMVEFRPVIKANANYKITYYQIDSTNTWKSIKVGDYIVIGAKLAFQITFDNDASELKEVVSPQLSGIIVEKRPSNPGYNIYSYITSKSPQKINITIDEYIRYEDIVQPYPVVFQIKDRNTNQIYSWGDKIKVGSSIQLTQGENPNLLSGLYSIQSYEYEGETYTYNQLNALVIIITKSGIQLSCNKVWTFDDNEPKCILSPRLLRIPNSSYKILGYIPDISGHGNNGKINNSAYASMSGANGYPYDYRNSSFWCDSVLAKVVSGELIEYFAVKNSTGFSNITSGVYKGEIKVTGVTKAISENKISRLRIYTNSTTDNELIDITQDGNYNIDIKGVGDANRVFFYAIPNNPNESIVVRLTEPIYIEQVGEYEGAYCLDGVNDFVTIPTLSSGGKQVLMKVNWNTIDSIIYDQRGSGGFAIYCSDYYTVGESITIPAYRGRNAAGTTYIDGIRNEYVIASQLKNVTHNIVEILDTSYAAGNINPIIGKSNVITKYGSLALYDFMLFDEISTDDKIKQLNEYVGIEAKVELPPYYWDAYGKTNLDADKTTIQQRGVAVGDYDLTNYNHAYNKMSGYGGYSFKSFNDSQDWSIRDDGTGVEIVSRDGYSITIKKLIQNLDWQISNNEYRYPTILDKKLPFKCISNKKVGLIWQLKYKTEGAISDTSVTLINRQLTPNVPLEINLPYKTQDELTELGAVSTSIYYLLYFSNTTLEIGEEYTVEMLPLYPNGLVYDGVEDYSKNENIPVLTDYTIIAKRLWINKDNPLNEQFIHKGAINTPIRESAFMLEYEIANDTYYRSSSYGGYINIERSNRPERIVYQTSNSYNGTSITKGSGTDTTGIVIGGVTNNYWNGVFYKLILYPKTIPLLQINFLKNLMERDEIIDLNNPIFIKNE